MAQKLRAMMKMEVEVINLSLYSKRKKRQTLILSECQGAGGGGLMANNNAASIQAEQVSFTLKVNLASNGPVSQ